MSMTPGQHSVVSEQWQRYNVMKNNGHTKYMQEAEKCNRFYAGDQWDQRDLDKLNAQGRPAMKINMVLSVINAVLGEHSTSRADITFKPKGSGTSETANALNKVIRQVTDNNDYAFIESEVFADGIITGRGYFDIRIEFDDHMQGEVRIDSVDPMDVLLDPAAKEYDPDTWSDIIRTRWMTLQELELIYGKGKVSNITGGTTTFGADSMEFSPNNFGQGQMSDYEDFITGVGNHSEKAVRRIRVIERQRRLMDMCTYFVHPTTGDTRKVPPSWDEARAQTFATENGLFTTKRKEIKIRWTVTADSVLLHDGWSPYSFFTIVPYFAYFRRGIPFGMVRNLLSPQEILNKVASQELHIVNTTANSGWMVEKGSLMNMSPEELEQKGSATGLVIEYAKNANPPDKIKPNTVPSGLDRISAKTLSSIKEISGVNDSMLGMDRADVSGVAMQAKQQRGLVQVQAPMDNLAYTRRLLACRILTLVQEYYTEERIVRTTNYTSAGREMEETVVNQATESGLFNDLTLGEYDVVVSSSPARDNHDETQFAETLQLREAGVAIPDDEVVRYSHLDNRAELAERLRNINNPEPTPEQQQMQQQMQEMEAQRMQLELQELQAKIEKLSAEAEQYKAKSIDLIEDDSEIAQTAAKIQISQDTNRSMLQAKQMQAAAQQRVAEIQAASKLDVAELQAKSDMIAARLRSTPKVERPETTTQDRG